MARKAGVTAEQTRSELLSAAARVFALEGYDGASISDITSEAGLSSGAVYTHYASKAELFVAVLRAHGERQYSQLLGSPRAREVSNIADFVTLAGSTYDRHRPGDAALIIEAIAAAKRDPEVNALVSSWLNSGEELLAGSIKQAQSAGALHDDISPETISRLTTMLALGSFLTAVLDIPKLDHDDWTRMLAHLVDSFRKSPAK
jgi:AcrR family transcriptional regulator